MSKIAGYSFQEGPLKPMMRNEVIRYIVSQFNTGKKLSGFTLPSDTLVVEKQLHELYGGKLTLRGVEKDLDIFKRAKKIIAAMSLPMVLTNEQDKDFWKNSTAEFDFTWLDYCGPFCESKKQVLCQLVRGYGLKITKKQPALLAFTLLDTMDLWAIESLKLAVSEEARSSRWGKKELYYRARLGGIPKMLNNEANQAKHTLRPLISYRYLDKVRAKKACPMRLFICAVEKGIRKYDVWQHTAIDLESDVASAVKRSRYKEGNNE